jgi:hypothetical protein
MEDLGPGFTYYIPKSDTYPEDIVGIILTSPREINRYSLPGDRYFGCDVFLSHLNEICEDIGANDILKNLNSDKMICIQEKLYV